MGTHLIPREVEGEGRILIIFTMRGFIGTLIGIVIGAIFHSIFSAINAPLIGWIFLAVCALIGFVIGQVKLPASNSLDLLKKAGGDYIYEIIIKYFKFNKTKKIYTYDKGGVKK
ncbi:MAG: hypothetical protein IJ220_05405 [Clostridia bacterium]|nr:hypothetical protein [Clostridia bacterium]